MTKKIFRTILSVCIVIMLLSTVLFSTVLLRHYTARVFDELEMEAVLAGRGVDAAGEAARPVGKKTDEKTEEERAQ